VVNFVATPNEGFAFKKFVQNRCEESFVNSLSVTVNSQQTVFIHFTSGAYHVNFGVVNPHGSISATVNGAPITSGATIAEGSMIDFTATPMDEYKVKQWYLNGTPVEEQTSNTYSIELDDDINVTVEFETIVGIREHNLSLVEIFPNPVTHELMMNHAEQVTTVSFANSFGQIVKEERLTGKPTAVISTQHLPSGVYFVRIVSDHGTSVKKFVKQ
jgi:hypothetical protein